MRNLVVKILMTLLPTSFFTYRLQRRKTPYDRLQDLFDFLHKFQVKVDYENLSEKQMSEDIEFERLIDSSGIQDSLKSLDKDRTPDEILKNESEIIEMYLGIKTKEIAEDLQKRAELYVHKNVPLRNLKARPDSKKWLISLSFWVPRKYREGITGDILEDCDDLRKLGKNEWRIRTHVLWHFSLAVIMLWPEAIGSALASIFEKIFSIKK